MDGRTTKADFSPLHTSLTSHNVCEGELGVMPLTSSTTGWRLRTRGVSRPSADCPSVFQKETRTLESVRLEQIHFCYSVSSLSGGSTVFQRGRARNPCSTYKQ
ncbi:unnamed protein product [Pleuronectes platessa]|uniref:Uncharacterized protein n=1 Tax=Pleuronectes platessa TaxID=8262 RepID=A0A9N7V3A6_PLEPL|nr:unnamed protein product [Pleuronectes platessa]